VFAVVPEILAAFRAAAFGEAGLATALAALPAVATGSVAAVVVRVALFADLLASSRVSWQRSRDGQQDDCLADRSATEQSSGQRPGQRVET
jgi:hypothetical protein